MKVNPVHTPTRKGQPSDAPQSSRHFNTPQYGDCDQVGEPVTKRAGLEAERCAAWQRDTLAAKAAGWDVLTIGPYQVALSNEKEVPATNRVMLVDGNVTESETEKAIPKLKAALKKHKSALEIEYNEAAFPNVGAWLEAGGLKLARKNPLLALRPETFKPSVAPEVHLTQPGPTAIAAELEAFRQIRWTD